MRLMMLMMRLCIILMPRSLCVCVRLGVTFTFIFIISPSLVANLSKTSNEEEAVLIEEESFELSLISKALNISTFRGGLERALATVC
jgi:hypothetical protein